jgi:hypothetical protein
VIDVADPGGPAEGRWRVSADAGAPLSVTATDASAGVRLPAAALGAAYLGGVSVARLGLAGWLDEEVPGAAAQLGALLGWSIGPWCPTEF